MQGNDEHLLFSQYFPPRNGQSWYWYLRNTLGDIPRVWRAKRERKLYGWAFCDVWNIDHWFMHVLPEMLRHLAETGAGYPNEFSQGILGPSSEKSWSPNQKHPTAKGYEAWQQTLRRMADDIEAYRLYDKHPELWFTENGKPDLPKADQAYSRTMAGLEAFKEWFFGLWD